MSNTHRKELFLFFKAYLLGWLLFLVLILIIAGTNGLSRADILDLFPEVIQSVAVNLWAQVMLVVPYFLFVVIRYFIRSYQRKGLVHTIRTFTFSLLLPVVLLYSSGRALVYFNLQEDFDLALDSGVENASGRSRNLYEGDQKHRGVNYFGWRRSVTTGIDELTKNNVEWVALVPYRGQRGLDNPNVGRPEEIGRWSRRDSSYLRMIYEAHDRGIRVMLKPHLWVSNGGWRAEINLASEEEWDQWFAGYEAVVTHYARMAAETEVELFCIGTELHSTVLKRPDAWKELIACVREIYNGPLTYAANWDREWQDVPFWEELDFIGLQAYFPLTDKQEPTIEELEQGWQQHKRSLLQTSRQYDKPILFTEVGYKSTADGAVRPWEWASWADRFNIRKSYLTQRNAYEALFRSFWEEPWFAGLYIWQWDCRNQPDNLRSQLDFTPQHKPAQETMARWFGKD